MKNVIVFSIILFSTACFAFQCPPYHDFHQDKDNVWHLTNTPPAPAGTFWKPMTQGPLAPQNHIVNSINVQLTHGTYPGRVHCFYGNNGRIYMGMELQVSDNQKPKPGSGAPYEDSNCYSSPEVCTFDVTN
jgi:hypothetical protein